MADNLRHKNRNHLALTNSWQVDPVGWLVGFHRTKSPNWSTLCVFGLSHPQPRGGPLKASRLEIDIDTTL
eukprot:6223998-Pyramimonas_sp.AAC.1